ncbi:MAG: nuclear transport factor 2 family protein [Pseudomonadales bacterium]
MNNEETIAYVKQFYADFLACTDLPAFLEKYIVDEVVWENFLPSNIPFGGSFSGKAAYAEYLTILLQAIDMQQFDIDKIVVDGELVVIFGSETSKVYATELSYTMDWIHELKIVDGMIVYAREYNDTAAMTIAFPPAG